MTDFDRREIVSGLTALGLLGALAKPDKARAGGDFDSAYFHLFVLSVLIVILFIIAGNLAFSGKMTSAKLVMDGRRRRGPRIARRLNSAPKRGTIKMQGDQLYATLDRKGTAAIANKRSIKISIPIPGEDKTMELKVRRQGQRMADKILTAAKSGGKTVGTVHIDSQGLIFNLRQAKLG